MRVKSKRKLIIGIGTGITLTGYLFAACLPYAGRLKVSSATKERFRETKFLSDDECNQRVRLLDDSAESLRCRIRVCAEAKRELYFTSYATHPGVSRDVFFGALLAAAGRGVKVNILLDAKFGKLDKAEKNLFAAHENIRLWLYNPINIFRPDMLNVSLHDKFLIADEEVMIFGGRNVGDKYYDFNTDKKQVRDREILISGNSAGDVKQYFDVLSSSPLSKPVRVRPNKKTDKLHARLIFAYETYLENMGAEIDLLAGSVAVRKITLVHNPVSSRKKEPVVAYNLFKLAECSSKIVMQSPYVILNNRNMWIFSNLVRGKDITLLTNSISSTPNLPAYSSYLVGRRKYLAAGVKIYEYESETDSIHGKSYIFDGRLSAVGSFNLDERSIRIDTESVLIIDGEEFAEKLSGAINAYKENSSTVSDSNKNTGVAAELSKPHRLKKFIYSIMGFLLRPFKYLM